MYWKEIPVQIEFSSSSSKKSVKLDERFQYAVDSISMKDGSYGSDDYLEGWQWMDKEEINDEFTQELIDRYLDKYEFPQDLIKKISQLIDENSRSEMPGSIDEWILNNQMNFKDALKKTKIILGDGATGTFLQKKGLEPGGCPELMNSEKQDAVIEMASRYFESGSDFVLTNTFGGSPFMLKKYGFEDKTYEFNKAGAELAVSVCPNNKFVIFNTHTFW